MLKKLTRQECLDRFTAFPLREYDRKNEEVYYYPKIYSKYWLKLEAKTTIQFKKKLALEITEIYKELKVERLTFLCDYSSPWITKNSKNRTDYKELFDALNYLRNNNVGSRFN